MALFRGYENQQGSRSHTALVRSGHMSPAEKWILDPTFLDKKMSSIFKDGVLFNYQYGGPGMDEVVIPKGRVVGVGASVKDFVSKKFLASITLPGLALNANTIGMAPYNFTKDWFQLDRFGGNQPSIITLDYVELPYMPGFTPEKSYDVTGVLKEEQAISVDNRMPWGAVIGECQNGDYLKATPSGRLTKWKSGTDKPEDIVGQVLASDLNAEPTGWLKWMLWEEQYKYDDDKFINRSGVSNLPSDEGYPFDPTYAEGNTIFQNYQSNLINNPTGIIGLHDGSGNYDGFGKNDTEYKDIELGTKEASKPFLGAFKDFAGGILKNIQQGVVVKVAGSEVPADKVTIDYRQGLITIAADVAEGKVTATYKAMHYGTPSWADFKGVQGAMYVLLKK
ncbi:MAG: hypothetical protein SPJ62_13780 [Inconstantimicrobium porci]|uniref:hypothetical protein n=1 Tax=Inconstantimicrobium porci TaxID=2652291 RepID=UPI002A91B05F|nr:hypothetical protein [Inconstantimicrobium porci]MDY5913039.1 hypothetical protein [Inconstantimicrobium porci]